MKYVVVTGGVVSGLGKGITSSSIGLLLKESGLRVTSIKIDPYLNVDAGTMSPYEHGEVYVLDDGGEADLDLGNYERFMDVTLTRDHNITTGKVYQRVIERERRGDYLGKTVQVVPHITTEVRQWIENVSQVPVDGSGQTPDVCMIELGGTVGDIESMIFLEALRQLRLRVGADNFCLVHVSLVPVVGAVGEPKSKPTQHSVKELLTTGLHPDIIVCRSTKPLDRQIIGKISMFSMVPGTHVIGIHDVGSLYEVPLLMLSQKVPGLIMGCLRLNKMQPDALPDWEKLHESTMNPGKVVTIGVVGKYTGLTDSYLSVIKALQHAGIHHSFKVDIKWIESNHLEDNRKSKHPEEYEKAWDVLKSVDGILIPGGFGDRGVEGKILAAGYARTNKIPYLGICLGMQVAVIEYARNVCEMKDANSAEFDEDADPAAIVFMPEISQTHMGGTMRLGLRTSTIIPGTIAHQIYGGKEKVSERHRHRYEVNPELVETFKEKGLQFSGVDDVRMEMIELDTETHPYFFATQFHPEYTSRPLRPSPPFLGLIEAAAGIFERRPVKSSPRSKSKK